MTYENTFVREVKEKNITNPLEILNWYRNLYHTEDNHTEQGIMAYAINDVFKMLENDVVTENKIKKIFEEIDKFTYRYLNDIDYAGGDLIYDIAELKNKIM